jgi:hypothetical protein
MKKILLGLVAAFALSVVAAPARAEGEAAPPADGAKKEKKAKKGKKAKEGEAPAADAPPAEKK